MYWMGNPQMTPWTHPKMHTGLNIYLWDFWWRIRTFKRIAVKSQSWQLYAFGAMVFSCLTRRSRWCGADGCGNNLTWWSEPPPPSRNRGCTIGRAGLLAASPFLRLFGVAVAGEFVFEFTLLFDPFPFCFVIGVSLSFPFFFPFFPESGVPKISL